MKIGDRMLRFARREDGVAAIEMAFILPVMLIMFVGLIDLTALLSDSRRVSYATHVVGDDVIRLETPTSAEAVRDSFAAAGIMMRAAQARPARVEIYTYQRSAGAPPVLRWDLDNGVGVPCGTPSEAGLGNLMTAGNDLVIAVVCATHKPIITKIFGENILGKTEFTLREQIVMRPRAGSFLECPDC
jgi:hypothetical protein